MALTLLKPPQQEAVLPAGTGLSFVDSANGEAVTSGLRCSLLLRRDGRLLGQACATPGGVHHWPELAPRWQAADPLGPVLADVLVQDTQGRFLPLSLPWPLPASSGGQVLSSVVLGAARLLRVNLLSAPGRRAPPALVSLYGLLAWQAGGQPAAWARLSLTDCDGRVHAGGTDGEGRLSLHLPRPRPDRVGLPPSPAMALRVFADPALAAAAQARGAPDALAFAAQPEVRALAQLEADTAYVPPAFTPGEPLVLATGGLPPLQRELRLAPL